MPMTPQEMIKLLKKNSFEVVSQNGCKFRSTGVNISFETV